MPAYSIYRVFLGNYSITKPSTLVAICPKCQRTLRLSENRRKFTFYLSSVSRVDRKVNQRTTRYNPPVDSQTCFQHRLRTARHPTVVIVISFILYCYNLFISDRITLSGAKIEKNSVSSKFFAYIFTNSQYFFLPLHIPRTTIAIFII